MRKHRAGSVWMILPLYLFTLIFVALPLLYVAALSFSTADGGYGVNWKFTLDNYKSWSLYTCRPLRDPSALRSPAL